MVSFVMLCMRRVGWLLSVVCRGLPTPPASEIMGDTPIFSMSQEQLDGMIAAAIAATDSQEEPELAFYMKELEDQLSFNAKQKSERASFLADLKAQLFSIRITQPVRHTFAVKKPQEQPCLSCCFGGFFGGGQASSAGAELGSVALSGPLATSRHVCPVCNCFPTQESRSSGYQAMIRKLAELNHTVKTTAVFSEGPSIVMSDARMAAALKAAGQTATSAVAVQHIKKVSSSLTGAMTHANSRTLKHLEGCSWILEAVKGQGPLDQNLGEAIDNSREHAARASCAQLELLGNVAHEMVLLAVSTFRSSINFTNTQSAGR